MRTVVGRVLLRRALRGSREKSPGGPLRASARRQSRSPRLGIARTLSIWRCTRHLRWPAQLTLDEEPKVGRHVRSAPLGRAVETRMMLAVPLQAFPFPVWRYPLTKFVVDSSAVLHLASVEIEVPDKHKLLAPTLLRSQTLSALHEAAQRGDVPADVARERLARIGRMPIRLLGDAVLRRRAWEVADRLGWASTYDAEYVALTQLQGDALVTLDADLARSVEGIVETASVDALR
jgi:predicted nucleic acid-binding protein